MKKINSKKLSLSRVAVTNLTNTIGGAESVPTVGSAPGSRACAISNCNGGAAGGCVEQQLQQNAKLADDSGGGSEM